MLTRGLPPPRPPSEGWYSGPVAAWPAWSQRWPLGPVRLAPPGCLGLGRGVAKAGPGGGVQGPSRSDRHLAATIPTSTATHRSGQRLTRLLRAAPLGSRGESHRRARADEVVWHLLQVADPSLCAHHHPGAGGIGASGPPAIRRASLSWPRAVAGLAVLCARRCGGFRMKSVCRHVGCWTRRQRFSNKWRLQL